MMKKSKKAQMEIMGLLVIVILITVILLIVVTLDVTNTGSSQSEQTSFAQEQLTGTIGITIMETTTECTADKEPIRELAANCIFSDITCVDGTSACEYLNRTIKEITEQTLDKTGLNYSLTIGADSQPPVTKINDSGCSQTKSSRSSRFVVKPTYVRTTYGSIIMKLTICN